MKIRVGFVSNSSSSSFVAIGVELTKELDEKKILMEGFHVPLEDFEKDDFNDIWYENIYKNGYLYNEEGWENRLLYIIASSSDDYLESGEFDVEEIKKIGQEMIQKFNLDPDTKIKLYVGTRMS